MAVEPRAMSERMKLALPQYSDILDITASNTEVKTGDEMLSWVPLFHVRVLQNATKGRKEGGGGREKRAARPTPDES